MGVDMTITHAVGVILDMDPFEAWHDEIDPEGEYYGEEYLYEAFSKEDHEGIGFGTAGSYYTNDEPIVNYLYISRLTQHFSDYEMPGGIMEGPTLKGTGVATNDEAVRIYNLAQRMGTKFPEIKTFTGILWH